MSNKIKIELIKNDSGLKVLSLSGEPGNSLSEHKVNKKALLLMRTGSVIYKEADRMKTLSAGDSCDIPPNIIHKVTCTTKAKFFVIMPEAAKLRFDK